MLWLLLLLALSEGGRGAHQCPPPEAIQPCSCHEGALACSGPLALSPLLRQGACGARLLSFQLSRATNVSALPDNLFFRVSLQSITISESPLLEQLGALLGQELSLQQLSVRGCQLREEKLQQLGRLQALRSLDLSHNHLQHTPAPLPPSLHSLFLRGNRISTLRPGDLSGLTSLIQLDLSENRLQSITRGSLPAPQLIFLTLNRNLLPELPEGVFEEGGGNLRRVDLSDNLLSDLPCGVWAPVWGDLHKLDLAGNPIQCHLLEDWMRNPEALLPPENVYGLNCSGILIHREEDLILTYN